MKNKVYIFIFLSLNFLNINCRWVKVIPAMSLEERKERCRRACDFFGKEYGQNLKWDEKNMDCPSSPPFCWCHCVNK